MGATVGPLTLPIGGDASGLKKAAEEAVAATMKIVDKANLLKAALKDQTATSGLSSTAMASLRLEYEKAQKAADLATGSTKKLAFDGLKSIETSAKAASSGVGQLRESVSKVSSGAAALGNAFGQAGGDVSRFAGLATGALAAFAGGGAIGLGLAALTGIIATVSRHFGELGEKAKKAADDAAERMHKLKQAALDAKMAVDAANGGKSVESQRADLDYGAVAQRRDEARAAAESAAQSEGLSGIGITDPGAYLNSPKTKAALEALALVTEELTAAEERATQVAILGADERFRSENEAAKQKEESAKREAEAAIKAAAALETLSIQAQIAADEAIAAVKETVNAITSRATPSALSPTITPEEANQLAGMTSDPDFITINHDAAVAAASGLTTSEQRAASDVGLISGGSSAVLGAVGSAVGSGVAPGVGTAIGGVVGSLVGSILPQLAEQFGTFQPILAAFGVVTKALAPAFALLEPAIESIADLMVELAPLIGAVVFVLVLLHTPLLVLITIVAECATVMARIVNTIGTLIYEFAKATGIVGDVQDAFKWFEDGLEGITDAIKSAVTAIGIILDPIIGDAPSGSGDGTWNPNDVRGPSDQGGVHGIGDNSGAARDHAREIQEQMNSAASHVGGGTSTIGEQVHEALAPPIEELTDAVKEFNRSVNNLPLGYKGLAFAEYEAQDNQYSGSGGGGGWQPLSTVINIENFVAREGVQDALGGLQGMASRGNLNGNVSRYSVRDKRN